MRAAVLHGKEDLRIEEVPFPGEPGPGQALLRVHRAAVCGTDSSEWSHGPRLTHVPVTLGHEFMGRVDRVGSGVEDFAEGDRVVSGAGVWCGTCDWCRAGRTNLCVSYYTHGLTVDGGLAGHVVVPVKTLVPVPSTVSDDAAAVAQPFAVAIHAVRRSGTAAGDTVVVVGIGGIGAFIVAAVADRKPARLIAIDIDPGRLETARRLGATEVNDARGQDLADLILQLTGGRGATVVFEASGAPHAPAAAIAAVERGGRVALVGLQAAPRELDLFDLAVREIDVSTSLAHVCGDDLPDAVRILAGSDLSEVVIGQTISLDDLVESGMKPLAEGRAQGKTIIDPWCG